MVRRTEDSRREIVDKILAMAKKKLPPATSKLIAPFISQYFSNAPIEDLEAREIIDLYGAAISHWHLLYERHPGECKIQVYNPDFAEHGWQSTHTIIEVSQDDMPFLVDSLRLEVNRMGFSIHLLIHMGGMKLRRNSKGQVIEVLPYDAPRGDTLPEAPIYIEIDRQTDPQVLHALQTNCLRVLSEVRDAYDDWPNMCEEMRQSLNELEKNPPPLELYEINETKEYLSWLLDNHFIFLGYREYQLVGDDEDLTLVRIPTTGLGVLRDKGETQVQAPRSFTTLPPEARVLALSPQILVISKTNKKASVHRDAYMDYVGVKRFDKKGRVRGERRFIGLYTSAAYTSSAMQIPFLRHKVATVMERSKLPVAGHAGKALLNILETLPRDDLLQASTDELLELGMGILQLQDRQKIRLFVRKDIYSRFVSCLVYLPRDRINTELRMAIQEILMQAFNGVESSFSTQFFDSILGRIHYVIRTDTRLPLQYDLKDIERAIIAAGRTWYEELVDNLREHFGEEKGNQLAYQYAKAFPAGYREDFDPRVAVYDIEQMERFSATHTLEMNFYRPLDEAPDILRFKLFQPENPIPLSDVLPILENMGLRVLGERPHEIIFADKRIIWINDFGMLHVTGEALDIAAVRNIFQEAFEKIWCGEVENDGFNKLGLAGSLTWREIVILRAYTKYLRQIGSAFSQPYIEETAAKNPVIAKHLVELFKYRFDPALQQDVNLAKNIETLEATLHAELEAVTNLDEDRILRRFLELIKATLRTNFYQTTKDGKSKPYLALKFDPTLLSDLPLPRPKYEIFVYAARFEGVHLRTSKVARGGIRWSDRREDFRTEILGLMKAQQVKNAVIVPSGAKGGFVAKALPGGGTREAIMQEVVECYQQFIQGLLDLTDNRVNGQIQPPENTVRYDDDDSYLVVAADKGTATFSDIANAISEAYRFWLGDAFASGGSAGYDHKKIGITARGAWESVKRHFRQLGISVDNTPFTVVGIGDMAGDVFGNGMLQSRCIQMIGAFNHQHIFIDPSPDPEKSYQERERLFHLPRSTWEDYNPACISAGGGVFKRSAKFITVSPEMKTRLGLSQDTIEPNELIRVLLRADVDLLWNGGIGTFVKAQEERHADVGDRTNDAIRLNGNDLRCRVVGEGGNLGFTQLGRVEYSLCGGLIYTDFIDNSGGVDCSDHEVNIKILLNPMVASGDLTLKARNQLLAEMTDEVAELVLRQNYYQPQALDIAAFQAASNIDLYSRYMDEQERQHKLERALEFLPDSKALMERKVKGQGLTRPELAVLLAYCKNNIKHELLNLKLPEDPYLSRMIEMEFPKILQERFFDQMKTHSLRREIVATQIANFMVNNMGVTFVHRLHDETGAPLSSIVRAFSAAQKIFDMRAIMSAIEALDGQVSAEVQIKMMTRITRLVRRTTRWFLRNRRSKFDITATIDHFSAGVEQLYGRLPELLTGSPLQRFEELKQDFLSQKIPEALARRVAISGAMFSVLDVIETATVNELDLEEVATVYFTLDEHLGLGWFRDQISDHPVRTHWDALARAALRDDIDWQQRGLTVGIIRLHPELKDTALRIQSWVEKHRLLVRRWESMLTELRGAANLEFIMFSVAVRELLDLTQASTQSVKLTKGHRAHKSGGK